MFETIKLFFAGKLMMIVIIIGSLLLAGLGTMTVLYTLQKKDYAIQAGQLVTITEQKKQVTEELKGVNQQIASEKLRHATLELKMKKNYELSAMRQKDLMDQKVDAVQKELALKDPKAYESKSQKSLEEFTNRMNCLTGNVASCSK